MQKTPAENLLPGDIDDSKPFYDSIISNNESERIVRNIITVQKKINPKAWTPFSFDDYRKHSNHQVTELEHRILNVFVSGGRPIMDDEKVLSPGYLIKDNDDRYQITPKFCEVVQKFAIK